jgi:hypothetical protein
MAAAEKDPSKPMADTYKEISGLLGIAAGLELALAIGLGYVAFKHVEAGPGRFLVFGLAAGLGAGAIVNGIDAYNHVKLAEDAKAAMAPANGAAAGLAGAAYQR